MILWRCVEQLPRRELECEVANDSLICLTEPDDLYIDDDDDDDDDGDDGEVGTFHPTLIEPELKVACVFLLDIDQVPCLDF